MNLLPTPRRLVSALKCSKRKARAVDANADAESVIFEKVLKLVDDCPSEEALETDEVIFEKLEKIEVEDVANDDVGEPCQPVVEIAVLNKQHGKKQRGYVATNSAEEPSTTVIEVEFEGSKPIPSLDDDMTPISYSDQIISEPLHCMINDTKLTEPIPNLSQNAQQTLCLTKDGKPHASSLAPIRNLTLNTNLAMMRERNADDYTGRNFAPQMLLHRSLNNTVEEVAEQTNSLASGPELVRFMSHIEGKEKGFEITLNDFNSFLFSSTNPQSNPGAINNEYRDDVTDIDDNEYTNRESSLEEKLQETSSELEQSCFQTSNRDEIHKIERSISRFSRKIPPYEKKELAIPTQRASSRLSHEVSCTSTRGNKEKEDAISVQRSSSRFSGKRSRINIRESEKKGEAVPVKNSGSRFLRKSSHISTLEKEKLEKVVPVQRLRSRFSRKGSRVSVRDNEDKEKAVSVQRSGSRFSRKASRVSGRDAGRIKAVPAKRSGSRISQKRSCINTQENEERKKAVPAIKRSDSRFSRNDSRINARKAELVEAVPDKRSSSDFSFSTSRVSSQSSEEKGKAVSVERRRSYFSHKGSRVRVRGAEKFEVLPSRCSSSQLSCRGYHVSSQSNEEDPIVSKFVMSKAGLPPLGITSFNTSSGVSSE